jgi:cytoskeleton protein RodZ
MDNDQNKCMQGSGPGSLLCQGRVAQGLSREEVAQRLHLAARQIVALENDDYANLPGATYVRGYLRGYANLLGIKPEKVLEAYATLSGSSTQHSLSSLAPKDEITSQDHQVKFATYAVAAILLGLAVTWWQGREVEPNKPHTQEVAALPSAMEPDTDATTGYAVPADQGEIEAAPMGGPVVPVAPSVMPTPERVVNTPAPVPERPVTPKPVTIPVAITPAPIAPPAAVVSAATSAIRANLVLYADQESWIDVRDAQQNKLIYETVPAGRRVVLEGAVPLNLFIGNAPGVRVEFNGKPYDIGPHKRGLIARFTLGEDLAQHTDSATGR